MASLDIQRIRLNKNERICELEIRVLNNLISDLISIRDKKTSNVRQLKKYRRNAARRRHADL